MSTTYVVICWAVVFGFVTAGILASLFHAVTRQPMSFRLLHEGGPAGSLIALPLLAVSGPVVIARNAWRGRRIEGRAWGWLLVSAVLVGGWSFCIGLYVLDLLLKLRFAFLT